MNSTWSALRGTFHVDFNLLSPVAGAITALPLVTIFALGLAFTNPRSAISMAIGANLIAVVSLVGAPKLSLPLALADALTMGIGVFIGTVTAPYPWLHNTLLVPWCFGAGMLVVFGQTQAVIGTQAIIAYLVLGRFSGSPTIALRLSLLVVVGALIEVVALVILRLPTSLRYQRNRLANAFEALADYARGAPQQSAIGVLGVVDEAERALAAPSLYGRTDVRDLRSILDQARRIRLELTTMSGLRVRMTHLGARRELNIIQQGLEATANALNELSDTLRRSLHSSTGHLKASTFRSRTALGDETFEGGTSEADIMARQCVSHIRAIGGQIRSAAKLVEDARNNDGRHVWRPSLPTLKGPDFSQIRTGLSVLRENLHLKSSPFRHAIRLAVAVTLSSLVASWLALPRGYWVPFSVAVILRPDYSTLFRRGVGRLVGTIFGATLAAVLVSELHPDLFFTAVLVGLSAWAAYTTWNANFPIAIGFVTSLVLILLSTSLTNSVGTAVDRLIDVSLGGAIAVITYLVWPTSPHAGVSKAHADLFSALRNYLSVVAKTVQGEQVAVQEIASCSRASRVAWANAEAAVGRSVEEPSATRINPKEGRSILAAAMRILRAIHALRIEAERGTTVPAFDDLSRLVAGCLDSLDQLSDRFLNDTAVTAVKIHDLRALFRSVEARLDELDPAGTIGVHFDELVNAINTATHLAEISSLISQDQ